MKFSSFLVYIIVHSETFEGFQKPYNVNRPFMASNSPAIRPHALPCEKKQAIYCVIFLLHSLFTHTGKSWFLVLINIVFHQNLQENNVEDFAPLSRWWVVVYRRLRSRRSGKLVWLSKLAQQGCSSESLIDQVD